MSESRIPSSSPTASPTYGDADATVVLEIMSFTLMGILVITMIYITLGNYTYDLELKQRKAKYGVRTYPRESSDLNDDGFKVDHTKQYQAEESIALLSQSI